MHNLGTAGARQQAPSARGRGSKRHQRDKTRVRTTTCRPAWWGGSQTTLGGGMRCATVPVKGGLVAHGATVPATTTTPTAPSQANVTHAGGTRPPRMAVGARHDQAGARRWSHPPTATTPARGHAAGAVRHSPSPPTCAYGGVQSGGRANRGRAPGAALRSVGAPRGGAVTRRAQPRRDATHQNTGPQARQGHFDGPPPPNVDQQTPTSGGPREREHGRPLAW